MPPKRKLLVSTNFVKNDYRKNAKSKRRKTRHDSINLGERYSNGLLKVSKWKSKYEWIAEKKAQLNDNLYLELLDPEELKAVTLATQKINPAEHDNASELFSAEHCSVDSFAEALNKAAAIQNDDDAIELARLEAFEEELDRLPTKTPTQPGPVPVSVPTPPTLLDRTDSTNQDEAHAHNILSEDELLETEEFYFLDDEAHPTESIDAEETGSTKETLTDDYHSKTDVDVGELIASKEDTSLVSTPQQGLHKALDSTTRQMVTISHEVLRRLIRQVFGFSDFRPGQEQAILSVLAHQNTLLVLPTGGGKSLCYSLPALLFPGITLVITPLISLMQDQLEKLPPQLPGGFWNSTQSPEEIEKLMFKLRNGHIRILFVSPEKLLSPGFQRFMKRNLPYPGVSFACIDEAHCVSEWSHCFRPSYLRLAKVLFECLGVSSVLGLTATATIKTQVTIQKTLRVNAKSVYRSSVERSNLILTSSCDPDRLQALDLLLFSEPFKSLDSIIIYVSTQMQCNTLAQRLSFQGKKTLAYHAGLTPTQRMNAQNQFMKGKARIMVATIAFGMGLDKLDVRAVIHFNMPRTLEHYVQEIGRAGRDGLPAYCHSFYSTEDSIKMLSLSHSDGIEQSNAIGILQKVFQNHQYQHTNPSGSGYFVPLGIQEIEASLDVKEQMVATLMTHLELIPATLFQATINSLLTSRQSAKDNLSEGEPKPVHPTGTDSSAEDLDGDLIYHTFQAKTQELDDLTHEIETSHTSTSTLSPTDLTKALETQKEFPLFDPFAEIVSTIHNKVQIGFTKTHPDELSKNFPIVREIMRQNDHLRLFIQDESNKFSSNYSQSGKKRSWFDLTHNELSFASAKPKYSAYQDRYRNEDGSAIYKTKSSSSTSFWEKRMNGNRRGRSGKFTLDLCMAANYMGCHIADIQRDLLKLKADKQLSLLWSDQSYCIQIWKKPLNIPALASYLHVKLSLHESTAVQKVNIVSLALKFLSFENVRDSCISIRNQSLKQFGKDNVTMVPNIGTLTLSTKVKQAVTSKPRYDLIESLEIDDAVEMAFENDGEEAYDSYVTQMKHDEKRKKLEKKTANGLKLQDKSKNIISKKSNRMLSESGSESESESESSSDSETETGSASGSSQSESDHDLILLSDGEEETKEPVTMMKDSVKKPTTSHPPVSRPTLKHGQDGIANIHMSFRKILNDYFECEDPDTFLTHLKTNLSSNLPFYEREYRPLTHGVSAVYQPRSEPITPSQSDMIGEKLLQAEKYISLDNIIPATLKSRWGFLRDERKAESMSYSPPTMHFVSNTQEIISNPETAFQHDKSTLPPQQSPDFSIPETILSWKLAKPSHPLPPLAEMSSQMRDSASSLRAFIRNMILPIVEDRDLKIADLQEDLNRLKQRIDTCGNSIVALQSKLTELTELIVHHQPSNQADKIQKQEAKLSKTIDSLEGMIAMFRSKQEKLKDIAEISLSAVYTPRAIARVFHGLHSPAFPSSTWKRSPYWGELQHIDFEEIKSIAECVLYEILQVHIALQARKEKEKKDLQEKVDRVSTQSKNLPLTRSHSESQTNDKVNDEVAIDTTSSSENSSDCSGNESSTDELIELSDNEVESTSEKNLYPTEQKDGKNTIQQNKTMSIDDDSDESDVDLTSFGM